MRAAQYLRMSRESQEYSLANQMAAIQSYAQEHGFEVVRTYSDPARSGLDIKRRPGLQSLINDVLQGGTDFKAVLVLDVSRWGRFQDTDEAACYEFLCRRAGIAVHYCGEPFRNDGTWATTFMKMMKRAMAAEFLRELSAKVHAGQCRVASMGYKMGGSPGLGLRRQLLDTDGKPKMILQKGERKSIATERVTWAMGPQAEVALVSEIFSMFLERNLSLRAITRLLNDRGSAAPGHRRWYHMYVRELLTHPKYVGCAVFNRTSEKLRSRKVNNPPGQWITKANAFPAIVSQQIFDKARQKLNNFVVRRSKERLLDDLRKYTNEHHKPLPHHGAAAPGMASASVYYKRFGSIKRAYALIDHPGFCGNQDALDQRKVVAGLHRDVLGQLSCHLLNAKVRFTRMGRIFQLRGHGLLLVETARGFRVATGFPRWKVKTWPHKPKHRLIVIRLYPEETSVQDYVLLNSTPKVARHFTLTDTMAREIGDVYDTLAALVHALSTGHAKRSV